MSILGKIYDITNAQDQSFEIDEMFRDLYEQLRVSVLGALTFPSSATAGDILYASATNTFSTLADVVTGNALLSGGVGVAPSWGKIDLTTTVTGILLLANGGTGLGSFTQGDLLYFNSGTTLSKLAKDTNATRYLSNTGASNNPAWAQIALATGVSGDLPFANLIPATAISVLLGRGSASGAGDFEEITLGSGLTMTNKVLSSSGGGGGSNWSVLTNGDSADPELIFADGDVIMVVVP